METPQKDKTSKTRTLSVGDKSGFRPLIDESDEKVAAGIELEKQDKMQPEQVQELERVDIIK